VGGASAFAVVVAVLTLAWTGGALADPDVWWHVRTGRLILDSHTIPHSDPWSFTAPHGSWVPTSWLSDVAFAAVWRAAGDDGLRALRVTLAAGAIAATWLLARRYAATTQQAALATGLTVLALAPFLRERPQVLSFLFVAWLTVGIQRILEGHLPRVLPWVAICWLWANVHGMWFLLPVGALAAGVLAWLEDRSRVPLAARCTVVALLSWAAVLLTPVGPRLAWWPLVVRHTAAPITEWQPTVPTSLIGAPLLLLVAVIVIRWARAGAPVPATRVVYVLAVVLFGLLAFRNVAPAALLLVPELARPLGSLEQRAPTGRFPRVGLVAIVAGVVLAAVNIGTTATVSNDQPTRLVKQLAARGGDVRLLNHYDVGGLVTGTASPPLHVAIDGRTDIWSQAFVHDYLDALAGVDDWRALVDTLAPNAALLPRDSDIARGLVVERHWRVTGTEGRWELLEPTP
jgi:hypothetical protein